MKVTIIESANIRQHRDEVRRCTIDLAECTLIACPKKRTRKDGVVRDDIERCVYYVCHDDERREISRHTYDTLRRMLARIADDVQAETDVCLSKADGYVTSSDVWSVDDVWHTSDVKMLARTPIQDRLRATLSYAGCLIYASHDDQGLMVVDVYADDDDGKPVCILSDTHPQDAAWILENNPVSKLLADAQSK